MGRCSNVVFEATEFSNDGGSVIVRLPTNYATYKWITVTVWKGSGIKVVVDTMPVAMLEVGTLGVEVDDDANPRAWFFAPQFNDRRVGVGNGLHRLVYVELHDGGPEGEKGDKGDAGDPGPTLTRYANEAALPSTVPAGTIAWFPE